MLPHHWYLLYATSSKPSCRLTVQFQAAFAVLMVPSPHTPRFCQKIAALLDLPANYTHLHLWSRQLRASALHPRGHWLLLWTFKVCLRSIFFPYSKAKVVQNGILCHYESLTYCYSRVYCFVWCVLFKHRRITKKAETLEISPLWCHFSWLTAGTQ